MNNVTKNLPPFTDQYVPVDTGRKPYTTHIGESLSNFLRAARYHFWQNSDFCSNKV